MRPTMIKTEADAVLKLAAKISKLRVIISDANCLLGGETKLCSISNIRYGGSVDCSIMFSSDVVKPALMLIAANAQKELDGLQLVKNGAEND